MQATALLRYERLAPRKLRVVAKLIRGKPVEQAVDILMFSRKNAAQVMKKLLVSAIANAEKSSGGTIDPDTLVVREVLVDQGPTLKRWMPRAMGRATRINKKSSHVRITLDDSI